MGVFVDPTFDMPVGVNVAIPDVGGPSAGMIFTLAIVDLLTPEDESNGPNVAGTGTISPEGDVGPIGGIDLKMIGARRAGADWFLAPERELPERRRSCSGRLARCIGAGPGQRVRRDGRHRQWHGGRSAHVLLSVQG